MFLLFGATAAPVAAQEPTYFDYLASVPMLIGRDSAMAERFEIYGLAVSGSAAAQGLGPGLAYVNPSYRTAIVQLAESFSPVLRRNNFSVPRHWPEVLEVPGTRKVLHVDTWNAADYSSQLLTAQRLPVAEFGDARASGGTEGAQLGPMMRSHLGAAALDLHCDADDPALVNLRGGMSAGESVGGRRMLTTDETLQLLLAEALCPGRAPFVRPASQTQRVLYFDFPGEDTESWRRIYAPMTRATSTIYMHLFVYDNLGTSLASAASLPRYSLAMQYWFFYPFNDGGNNHEGDWEHMNVVVTTAEHAATGRAAPDGWLTESEVRNILEGQIQPAALRIAAVDYYFHNMVYAFDYIQLGVYQADEDFRRRPDEDRIWLGDDWIRGQLKRRTEYPIVDGINNHPVAYIGGNNVGLDQLLAGPGSMDANSHGSYPFPGTWKRVGPLGATERLNGTIPAEAAFFKDHMSNGVCNGFDANDSYLCYDAAHIRLLPDWDWIDFGLGEERAEWYWLVLPLRWGQPTTASPGSGLIRHFDVGNNAPIGPARNSGWNNLGTARSYSQYQAHALPEIFQSAPQDQFSTSLGTLNAAKVIATFLTPAHLFVTGWRLIKPAQRRFSPTLYPQSRAISISAGSSVLWGSDLVRIRPLDPFTDEDVGGLEDGGLMMLDWHSDPRPLESWEGRIGLHFGRKVSNETVFATGKTRLRGHFVSTSVRDGEPIDIELGGTLRTKTLANELRVAFLPGGFKPFVKAGYGMTWLRVRCDVDPASATCAERDRKDHGWTWLFGGGLEFTGVGTRLNRPDLGVRLEYTRGWTRATPDWRTALRDERWLDTNRFALLLVLGL